MPDVELHACRGLRRKGALETAVSKFGVGMKLAGSEHTEASMGHRSAVANETQYRAMGNRGAMNLVLRLRARLSGWLLLERPR
jgi:hypothetical protein